MEIARLTIVITNQGELEWLKRACDSPLHGLRPYEESEEDTIAREAFIHATKGLTLGE